MDASKRTRKSLGSFNPDGLRPSQVHNRKATMPRMPLRIRDNTISDTPASRSTAHI